MWKKTTLGALTVAALTLSGCSGWVGGEPGASPPQAAPAAVTATVTVTEPAPAPITSATPLECGDALSLAVRLLQDGNEDLLSLLDAVDATSNNRTTLAITLLEGVTERIDSRSEFDVPRLTELAVKCLGGEWEG